MGFRSAPERAELTEMRASLFIVMTARIGTAPAFFGLGVVFPLLLTLGTVILIGRLTGRRRG